MIEAARGLPDVEFKLAAASPWSKHSNRTESIDLPGNVTARRYEYAELRDLYASSRLVVVPLLETDFQAGITTILEAMAMGKAVVVTKTTGQGDVVIDGETGLYVSPGDATSLRIAISRLISEAEFASRLGANGRKWVEDHASLDLWSGKIAQSLLDGLMLSAGDPSNLRDALPLTAIPSVFQKIFLTCYQVILSQCQMARFLHNVRVYERGVAISGETY